MSQGGKGSVGPEEQTKRVTKTDWSYGGLGRWEGEGKGVWLQGGERKRWMGGMLVHC